VHAAISASPVRPSRTRSIALWSALGGGISALGPLVAGALLEGFDWWSVFLVTAPLAAIALFCAWRFVPAHVNETTEPVDHLGGILSIAMVGTLVLAINLAPEPGKGTTAVILGIIAVAAAGILRRQSIAEMTDSAWDDMLAVDLSGVMRVFRSCAARMNSAGAMVATSSIAGGVYGWEDHSHYAAAKAGVLGLCRSLAVELAPRGIRVNAVIPGLIESPQSLDSVNSLGPDGLREAGKIIPAGRVGTVDEAARAIRFLTSDDAAYVTGQSLIVDGGLTVRWPS